MTIPEVRDRLRELAIELKVYELNELADQLHRRKAVRRGSVGVSPPMTEELQKEITDYAYAHPKQTLMTIANQFGVNSGRVSEALNGKRT